MVAIEAEPETSAAGRASWRDPYGYGLLAVGLVAVVAAAGLLSWSLLSMYRMEIALDAMHVMLEQQDGSTMTPPPGNGVGILEYLPWSIAGVVLFGLGSAAVAVGTARLVASDHIVA